MCNFNDLKYTLMHKVVYMCSSWYFLFIQILSFAVSEISGQESRRWCKTSRRFSEITTISLDSSSYSKLKCSVEVV